MSNSNSPYGLRIVQTEGKQSRVREYTKKSGSVIAEGDPVIMDATGTVTLATGGDGVTLLGVAADYKAATSTDKIAVYDDPEAKFEVQVNGDFQLVDVFQNANVAAAAADPLLKRSKFVLDTASQGTGITKQLKIIELSQIDDNTVGSYARVVVMINNHALRAGVAGV